MDIVVIDFETFWDKDYTLSKMPTMQYVRDRRFRVLGCGLQFLTGSDRSPIFASSENEVKSLLGAVPWSRTVAVAHNAQFDGAILSEHYGIRPARWIDTQLLARWAIAQGHLPPD